MSHISFDEFLKKYQIIREIGTGSYAKVYEI
jgi:hypothetical protein